MSFSVVEDNNRGKPIMFRVKLRERTGRFENNNQII
jgi:hypothetical protein